MHVFTSIQTSKVVQIQTERWTGASNKVMSSQLCYGDFPHVPVMTSQGPVTPRGMREGIIVMFSIQAPLKIFYCVSPTFLWLELQTMLAGLEETAFFPEYRT